MTMPSPKTVAFHALGCRANQLEASQLAQEFMAAGWQVVPFQQKQHPTKSANVVVINTCTVTNGADSDSRYMIRKAIQHHPKAKIAVTGCYAQVSPEEVAKIGGVHYVIGNNFKQDITQILTQAEGAPQALSAEAGPMIQVSEMDKSRLMQGASAANIDRSRASLKIQDGCDFQCTYCIIWVARGKSRSLPTETVKTQLQQLIEDGFYEITLTGINIGQFEDPENNADLADLLTELVQINADFRLKLSSLDPFEVTPKLLDVMKQHPDKICPYLHLSMQSGQDDVLKLMARRHRMVDVFAICQDIKTALPHACLGADIIVGFPGETAEQFEETRYNLEKLPLNYFHVFSYSSRKGTPAATFNHPVAEPEKKRRSQVLMALSQAKETAFYKAQLGQTLCLVIEKSPPGGDYAKGISANHVVVKCPQQASLRPQTVCTVRVTQQAEDGSLMGALETIVQMPLETQSPVAVSV